MLYIILCVCFSVTVSVMFKLAKRYQIDVYQAVTWNYSATLFLTAIFLKPSFKNLAVSKFSIYCLLGLLLPALFYLIARVVRNAGIVRTEIAQRLSLVIPVIASFLLFDEKLDTIKLIAIIIGFISIMLTVPWQKQIAGKSIEPNTPIFLILVFLGMGVIDVLLKQLSLIPEISFGTSLFFVFGIAFFVTLLGLIYQVYTKRMRFSWPHIFIGWTLGIANFGNIFFYIKAHQALANHPSRVFSSINIGVIMLGTLLGTLVFKERLNLISKLGIFLAILAIIILAYQPFIAHLLS